MHEPFEEMEPTNRYAYYYPEGPGFYFVSCLGQGKDGSACLVQSASDGSYCVRRSTRISTSSLHNLGSVMQVLNSLSSVHVIRTAQSVHVPSGVIAIPNSTVACLYWEYVNGGNLAKLIEAYKSAGRPFPSILLWTLLSHLLDATTTLRAASITHGDVQPNVNISVHWPSPTAKLPRFVLGDLGDAELWAEAQKNRLSSGYYSEVRNDICDIKILVAEARGPADPEKLEEGESDGIESILESIDAALEHLGQHRDYAAFEAQIQQIERTINQGIVAISPDVKEYEVLRPDYEPSPAVITYPTIEALWGNTYRPPGPWRVAEIDQPSRNIVILEGIHCADEFRMTVKGTPVRRSAAERDASGLFFFPYRRSSASELVPGIGDARQYRLRDEGIEAVTGADLATDDLHSDT